MTKSKKIVCILSALLVGLVAVIMPFVLKPKQNTFAETIEDLPIVGTQYISSPLLIPIDVAQGGRTKLGYFFTIMQVSEGGVSILPSLARGNNEEYDIGSFTYMYLYDRNNIWVGGNADDQLIVPYNSSNYYFYKFNQPDSITDMSLLVPLFVRCSSNFNLNTLFYLEFGLIPSSDSLCDNVFGYIDYVFEIRYFDKNNNFFVYSFACEGWSTIFGLRPYDLRRYFFNSSEYPDNYQDGYNAGIDVGYNSGFTDGYDMGDSVGYNRGQSVGYNAGYNAGMIEANDYTFTSLIGATIDAPITVLTGLLNFEILGVNLSAFFFGLMTITLIIVIIKYIKGGS